MFKQNKHITDFIIEFKVLAIKAETDDMHAIFLLKKNIRIFTNSSTRDTERVKGGNHISWSRIQIYRELI